MLFRALVCSAMITASVAGGPAEGGREPANAAAHVLRDQAIAFCAARPADCLALATRAATTRPAPARLAAPATRPADADDRARSARLAVAARKGA